MWISRLQRALHAAVDVRQKRLGGRERARPKFRIAYAALNDAALMVDVFSYLQAIDVEADLFLDVRSDQEEINLLNENKIGFQFVENNHGFVEGVYGKIAEKVKEDWVFILTTDEVPTSRTLQFITETIESAPLHVSTIGFPRHWVLRDDKGSFAVSRAPFIGLDYQWRIIRHRDVVFTPIVHTAGFTHDETTRVDMPEDAAVFHLDWIVHSPALRRRKLAYYETIKPGCSKEYERWYLPENHLSEHQLEPLTDPHVLAFAKRLAKLRTDKGWIDALQR